MPQRFTIKAGERSRILHRFSNSLAQTYRFSARPLLEAGEVSGEVEVQGSAWLFAKEPVTQPLQADNSVQKNMWDTRYSVYVTPTQDVEITLHARRGGNIFIWIILALVVSALASVVLQAF